PTGQPSRTNGLISTDQELPTSTPHLDQHRPAAPTSTEGAGEMDLQIDGRIALVTGADSGIGYATAAELLNEGAIVVLTSRDADALERAGHELARAGGQIHALAADLRDTAAVAALREQVHQDVGQVDLLV